MQLQVVQPPRTAGWAGVVRSTRAGVDLCAFSRDGVDLCAFGRDVGDL